MGLAVDLVAVLGTVATVIVAVMTWRIANRQTSIAADMKTLTETATDAQQAQAAAATKQLALSEQQLNLSEHQGKIEQRLVDLEEARMYAELVPSHLQWFNQEDGSQTMQFSLNNAGGPAWNIQFTGIHFAYRDAQTGKLLYEFLDLDVYSLDICIKEETIRIDMDGHLPEFHEGSVRVLALTGVYRDFGGAKELLFERLPTALAKLLYQPSVRRTHDTWIELMMEEPPKEGL